MSGRQDFFDQVFQVLSSVDPRGLTFAEIGKRVRRRNFNNVPQWAAIPGSDARFQVDGQRLLLRADNVEGCPISPEDAAPQFNEYLQRCNITGGLSNDEVTALFTAWMRESGLRSNFHRTIEAMRENGFVHTGRDQFLYFTFAGEEQIEDIIKELKKDKGGIVISEVNFNAPFIELGRVPPLRGEVTIRNNGNRTRSISRCRFANNTASYSIDLNFPVSINPGQEVQAFVSYESAALGVHADTLIFTFSGFTIGRAVRQRTILNEAIAEAISSQGAYQRPARRSRNRRPGKSLHGAKPGSSSPRFVRRLPDYFIPKQFNTDLSEGRIQIQYLSDRENFQNATVRKRSYAQLFNNLLYDEERAMERDLANYAMENVSLGREGSLLVLTVPGLAEKRPSVLIGDSVTLYRHGVDDNTKYVGKVWIVRQQECCLNVPRKLLEIYKPNMKFDVEFSLNRLPLNIMHNTLSLLRNNNSPAMDNILFPSESTDLQHNVPNGQVSNNNLNGHQIMAVRRVIERAELNPGAQVPPFVIFGPPGTGKTSTMVEAILQVAKKFPKKKLLVEAPSNAAADVLLSRLSIAGGISNELMFRLMSYQRNSSEIEGHLLNYCRQDNHQHFICPIMDELNNYQIIVSTCSMASKLYHFGMPENHFDFVFIDECGHSLEPEVISSFINLSPSARIILAGDPKQLGPVIVSATAKEGGLQQSILDRYTGEIALYRHYEDRFQDTQGYDSRYIVQLVNCYRCHPAIIAVPNGLFYNNSLIPSAPEAVVNSLLNWEALPNNHFPVLFHGCQGEHERELNSPSWFNTTEVEQVIDHIQSLIHFGVRGQEIGVISPYNKQVKKIRRALEFIHENDITVGSCEQFQGQERRVIIISTVRSSTEYVEFDRRHDIGFLNNPKRFNVAITRAKALLIVVGNPFFLRSDPNWAALLAHCHENNSYSGVPIELGNLEERLLALQLLQMDLNGED
eukprot:gene7431-8218_t